MINAIAGASTRRIAGIVAIVGTLAAAGLHVSFGWNAGALWRDEVNSLEIATMSTFSELWTNLRFDSFPVLFFVLLRAFAGVPASASDAELRTFGVVIGLLVLACLWLNARWLRFGVPLISLGLIGFNPMVIRYGDSIRAYGLGMLLVLACIGAMWRLVERVTFGRALAAFLTAILSVQCLYYNSFLLFAVCSGAAAVCLRRREYKRILLFQGIGGAAGLSLLVYLSTIQKVQATSFFWRVDFTASLFWNKLSETLGSPVPLGTWLWVALFAFAAASASWILCRPLRSDLPAVEKDRLLFGLVTLLVGSAAYFGFLFHLSYLTQPWYYVVFVAFAATCLEIVVASLPWRQCFFRSTFAILFMGIAAQPAWAALRLRQTNVDVLAAHLQTAAANEDLILINTWNYGITFRRYYHGEATCATIPPIRDLRLHRMDLVSRQMTLAAPMAPVLEKMEETLRAGHTIWLIGTLQFVAPGEEPFQVSPERGWAFYRAWSEQAGFLVQKHANELVRVNLPAQRVAMHYEYLPLSAIRGWRDRAGPAPQ